MLFKNGELVVRKLEWKDNHLLAKWLSDPLVLEYYEGRDNPFNLEKVNKEFYQRENGEIGCIVEFEKVEIGYIQFYQLDNETRKLYGYVDVPDVIYGIDQFIGEINYWNRGIGTLLVKTMVEYLVEQKNVDRVVMDLKLGMREPFAVMKSVVLKGLSFYLKMNFMKGSIEIVG